MVVVVAAAALPHAPPTPGAQSEPNLRWSSSSAAAPLPGCLAPAGTCRVTPGRRDARRTTLPPRRPRLGPPWRAWRPPLRWRCCCKMCLQRSTGSPAFVEAKVRPQVTACAPVELLSKADLCGLHCWNPIVMLWHAGALRSHITAQLHGSCLRAPSRASMAAGRPKLQGDLPHATCARPLHLFNISRQRPRPVRCPLARGRPAAWCRVAIGSADSL